MITSKIDGIKLKQALEQFGSLQKAVQHLEKEELALQEENEQLKKDNKELVMTRDKLTHEIKTLNNKIDESKKELQSLFKQIKEHGRQYELFCGFMAMVDEPPSVAVSIKTLIASLQKLIDSGWYISKNADEMRSLFVRTIMGDFLKCFRCDSCGAKFIVNKEPRYTFIANNYQCPACHSRSGVKEDDSFLKAMVSEEQVDNTRRIEELQKENDALKPLKVFLNLPCEICGQPMIEWSEQDVRRGVMGGGWGHTHCWNTTKGQARQFAKLVKEEMERRMQNPSK